MAHQISREIMDDGKFRAIHFQFEAGGHRFDVLYNLKLEDWSVYRAPKGYQMNKFGKYFPNAAEMISHYSTAAGTLAECARMVP